MAENYKYSRLAQDVKFRVNYIINEQIDDLDFVTVTDVEMTKDLQDAKIYVQSLSASQEEYVLKTLRKKEGYIKRELAKSVKMRKIPSLIFKYDHSVDNYNKIDRLLKDEK